MVRLNFEKLNSVLCLGAHADDIEIGCGGSVLRLARERPGLQVWWVVFSAEGRRAREARASACALLKGAAKPEVMVKNFRDSFFPFQGEAIKEYFEDLKRRIRPDVVFTHYREDRHQDHRVLSDLAWNTFREHLILEYEIPKYDGDLGNPNFYVRLDEKLCRHKSKHICAFFQTQSNKHWFSPDTFLSLMRLRGIECASNTKYAEAFYCRKLVFG
ncbi:MAG TPA: PIG-L deacetylase family protein [Candidatus Acidoferrum sp.]|jgi:LmbE family N-acetylglucosaminyl deacetylase|nr:PIG-L deacetylase family protein [Candidatus Acidoferrum sp.]